MRGEQLFTDAYSRLTGLLTPVTPRFAQAYAAERRGSLRSNHGQRSSDQNCRAPTSASERELMRQYEPFTGAPLLPPSGILTDPRRPGVGCKRFRGPDYLAVDMSLVKPLALPAMRGIGDNAGIDVRAKTYNLFNTLNLTSFTSNRPSTQIENPYCSRATAALAGRVVEFQARFSF